MAEKPNSRSGRRNAEISVQSGGPSVQSQRSQRPTPAAVDVSSNLMAFGETLGNFFGRVSQTLSDASDVAYAEYVQEEEMLGRKLFAQDYQDFQEYYATLGNEVDAFNAWQQFAQERGIGEDIGSKSAQSMYDRLVNSQISDLEIKRGAARAKVQQEERNAQILDNFGAVYQTQGYATTEDFMTAVKAYSFNNGVSEAQAKVTVMGRAIDVLKESSPEEAVRLMEVPGTGTGDRSFAESYPAEYEVFAQEVTTAQTQTNGLAANQQAERIFDAIAASPKALAALKTEAEVAEYFDQLQSDIDAFGDSQGFMNDDHDRMMLQLDSLKEQWATTQVSFDHLAYLASGPSGSIPLSDKEINDAYKLTHTWLESLGVDVVQNPLEAAALIGLLGDASESTKTQLLNAWTSGDPNAALGVTRFIAAAAMRQPGSKGGVLNMDDAARVLRTFIPSDEVRDDIYLMLNRMEMSGVDVTSQDGGVKFTDALAQELDQKKQLGNTKPTPSVVFPDETVSEARVKLTEGVTEAANSTFDAMGFYDVVPSSRQRAEIERRVMRIMATKPTEDPAKVIEMVTEDVLMNSVVLIQGNALSGQARPRMAPNSTLQLIGREVNLGNQRVDTVEMATGHLNAVADAFNLDAGRVQMERIDATKDHYVLSVDGSAVVDRKQATEIASKHPYLEIVEIGSQGAVGLAYKPQQRDVIEEARVRAERAREAQLAIEAQKDPRVAKILSVEVGEVDTEALADSVGLGKGSPARILGNVIMDAVDSIKAGDPTSAPEELKERSKRRNLGATPLGGN